MRLKLRSGSLATAIGIAGGGVQLAFPEAAWSKLLGLALIAVAFITFLLDVEVENARITAGHGKATLPEHLRNGLHRLRANWLTLSLMAALVVVLGVALDRSWLIPPVEKAQPQATASGPARERASSRPNIPLPASAEPPSQAPIADPPATQLARRSDRDRALPTPQRAAPKLETSSEIVAPLSPAAIPAPSAPSTNATTPPAPIPKPAPPKGPTSEEIAAARQHRDEGDGLFKRLFDAKKTPEVNALLQTIDVWDRKGADLVIDVFGTPALQRYRAAGDHQFYPPYSMSPFASAEDQLAFWRRKDGLNLIRYRQQSLSVLFAPSRGQ